MSPGIQVVGLGLATLDVLIRLNEMPTWGRNSRIQGFRFDGGGLVGTAMVAAARLGARVGFCGTAGTDESAEIKLRSMVQSGIDLSHLCRRPGSEDQVVVVYVHTETGERQFAGMQPRPSTPLQVQELDRDYITAADYLHIDGFHYEASLQAAKWMRQAGKTVVMDGSKTDGPVGDRHRTLIEYVDVLITGSGYARGLTGIRDIWQAGEAIIDLGPRIFVETAGEAGSYTITREEQFHTPAFSVDVIDTTGAGDVFHGAYIVGMLHGWNLRHIAQFSTAVSAIKCTQLGGRTGIPDLASTLRFLQERNIHIE